jgi:hypothetical protein
MTQDVVTGGGEAQRGERTDLSTSRTARASPSLLPGKNADSGSMTARHDDRASGGEGEAGQLAARLEPAQEDRDQRLLPDFNWL